MASIAAIAMLNIQMVLFTQIHKPRRINEGIAVGLPAAGCTNPSFLHSYAAEFNVSDLESSHPLGAC